MTVVVGYVPTPEGGAALEEGILEATWRSSKLVVANVIIGNNFADVTAADEKDLDAVRARLDETSLRFEVVQPAATSDASTGLVSVIEEHEAELVVLAIHRVKLVSKLLLGSTIEGVMNRTQARVLIVRPQEW
jgi:nucleotide-binding universal stress UspA family protein